MKNKVLAVEFPAPCGQKCEMCRTPDNASGDPDRVLETFWDAFDAKRPGEVFIVSSGETGAARDFQATVSSLIERGIPVSVACAAPISIVPGLSRADVSATRHTHDASVLAIKKATELGIPTTISLVDDGVEDIPARVALFVRMFPEIRGYLVRAQQQVGRATAAHGKTNFTVFPPQMPMGYWPPPAYVELAEFADPRFELTCVDRWGRIVPYVGNHVPYVPDEPVAV